jgi:peptide/nickel transport system substrate-binding protein
MIDNAITINETADTVTFHLARLYPNFLQAMAETWSSILDKEWMTRNYHFPGGANDTFDWPGWDPTYTQWVNYNNYEREVSTNYYGTRKSPLDGPPQMLGTGPFIFVEWIPGEGGHRTLNCNRNYWGGWPAGAPGTARAGQYEPSRGYILRMIEYHITDWTVRKQGFIAGDYDWIYVPKFGYAELWQQTGIECLYPFYVPNIEAILPNWNIAGGIPGLSPYVGNEQWGTGLPLSAFSDLHMRKAFAYCFNYTQYLFDYTAPLGYGDYLEGFQPASPIVVGLAPFNPRTLRDWHMANKYSCNLALAEAEFRRAWDGQVWTQGFYFDYVYNFGNTARRDVGLRLSDILIHMNPNFHLNVVEVNYPMWLDGLFGPYGRSLFPLIPLMRLERDQVPPHAHNYAFEFMHSNGSLAYLQSYSNSTVDALIKAGNYDQLNQIYHKDAVGIPTVQDMDRRWQRDWVQGYRYNWWHYNPTYPGENLYTIWKEELPVQDVTEDGKIDIKDLATVAKAYGMYYYQPYLPPAQPGFTGAVPGWHTPNWNSRADIIPDKRIDIKDLASIARLFGWVAPPWPPPPSTPDL